MLVEAAVSAGSKEPAPRTKVRGFHQCTPNPIFETRSRYQLLNTVFSYLATNCLLLFVVDFNGGATGSGMSAAVAAPSATEMRKSWAAKLGWSLRRGRRK